MARSWYAYLGGKEHTSVINYIRIDVKHNCLCGSEICAIYVRDNGIHPAEPLSANIQRYIADALSTGQLQPSNPYNAKKYVYLR